MNYQLKKGYKLTEVGVIPDDWNVKLITEVTDKIFLGLTSKVDYVNHGGIPLVRATDISGGRLTFDAVRSISHKQHTALTKYRRAKRGDVLVSKSGSLGVCALVEVDTEFSIYESIIVLPPKHCLDSSFLLSLLRHEGTQKRMIGDRVGSTVGHLNLEVFRSLVIPLPPPPEQRSIASALSDMDALLVGLDRLIAKKRDLKQAAMQQLLTGKTRLPGFEGEWEVKTFGEAAFTRRDRVDPKRIRIQEFCIELEHIASGSGVLLGSTTTNENSSIKSVFSPGDVLFGKLRAYLRKYWLANQPGVCSTEIWVFVPNADLITAEFLFQVIKTDQFVEIASNSYGTHMPRSDWNVVSLYPVHLPCLHEQTAIATILSDMDAEIAALEQRRDKTRALKQGMMQELLTGRIRLIDNREKKQQDIHHANHP